MEAAVRCAIHPYALAGWRCGTCARGLCPACTGSLKAGSAEMPVCGPCGGAAQPIRARRAVLHPFGAHSLLEAIRWPFHREAVFTACACGLVVWLITKAGALAGLFAAGLVLAVLFHVASSTARGEDELYSSGDFRGFFEDVVGPLFRALAACMWVYAPATWYLVLRYGVAGAFEALQRSPDPVAVVLLLAGSFLFPMALLAGALGTPLGRLFNPVAIVGYAVRLGKDYALFAGFALCVSVALSLLLAVLRILDERVTAIPGFVTDTLLLFPALTLFRAMGLLVRARGDELGYGGESAYLEPVLGAAQPSLRRMAAPAPGKAPAGREESPPQAR